LISGEAPTANETTATIMAANAPAPRPCLKVLSVGCSIQNDLLGYFFALRKVPQFARLPFGVSANKYQKPSHCRGSTRRLAKIDKTWQLRHRKGEVILRDGMIKSA
jgi:hypothetical protein